MHLIELNNIHIPILQPYLLLQNLGNFDFNTSRDGLGHFQLWIEWTLLVEGCDYLAKQGV